MDEKVHPLFTLHRRLGLQVPCIDSKPSEVYLNTASVKQAIHAKKDIKWEICSAEINSNYNWTYDSMIPFYQKLLPYYRACVFSGDIDLAVNTMGTQEAVEQIGQPLVKDWTKWYYDSSQVAGFYRQYKNLDFVTVC